MAASPTVYVLLQDVAALDARRYITKCRRLPPAGPPCSGCAAPPARNPAIHQGHVRMDRLPQKEVLYSNLERHGGQSSFNLRGLCNLAVEGITSYTTAPLRLASVIGLLSAAAAMLYALYFLIKTIAVGDDVQGFPTLIIAILFLGGCQLLAIGIIGEYLGRIFNETKRRPPYIADSLDGEPVDSQS